MEPRRERLSQRRKAAESSAILRSQSEARQDTAGSADLFRPQPADTTVASPQAPGSAGADPAADFDAPSLASDSSRVAAITQLTPAGLTRPIGTIPAILAGSRLVKRFAVLGALAVTITGAAATAQLAASHGAPTPVMDAEATAPVAVIPASGPGTSASISHEDHRAPVATPIRNAEGTVPPAPVTAPEPPASRVIDRAVTISQPKKVPATVAPQSDRRAAALAEAYARARAAELSARERWAHRGASPRP